MLSRILIIVGSGLLASESVKLGFDAELRIVDQFNLSLNARGLPSESLADTGVAL
jgi:hypothetical protein